MENNDQATDVLWEEVLVSQLHRGDVVQWLRLEGTVISVDAAAEEANGYWIKIQVEGHPVVIAKDGDATISRVAKPQPPLPFTGILRDATLSDVSGTAPIEATLPQQTRKEIERQHSEYVAKRLPKESPATAADAEATPIDWTGRMQPVKDLREAIDRARKGSIGYPPQQTAESATVSVADVAAAIQKPQPPLPVVEEKCRNCRFWKQSYETVKPMDTDYGSCRLTPVSVAKMAGDWCGEYEAAATPQPQRGSR